MAAGAVKVFFSYSQEDEDWRAKLERHLKPLERNGLITIWHDRKILPGEELNQRTTQELETAQLIVLLISPDFIASDDCWEKEVQRAIERRAAGEVCVIPVILRPVDLHKTFLSTLKALPSDQQPITTWSDRDAAFQDVAGGIRSVAEQLAHGISPAKISFSSPRSTASLSKNWQRRRLLKVIGLSSIGVCAGAGSSLLAKRLLQSPSDPASSVIPDFPFPFPEQKESPPASGTFTFEVVTIDQQGNPIEQGQGQAQRFVEQLGDTFSLEMVLIPAGTFEMGSTSEELGRSEAESPVHTVNLPAFALGRYPITQTQWKAVALLPPVARDLNPDPSHFKGAMLPVETISWLDAVEFCQRLARQTGRQYRLPSEAEWEYACRARTKTPFHFGETLLSQLANYDGEYAYKFEPAGVDRKATTPVGFFKVANAFGLSDMHGNVWEFCQDHWRKNYVGAPTNGSVRVDPSPNYARVVRGGSWLNRADRCRSAHREWCYERLTDLNLGMGGSNFGLRVACSLAV